MRRDMRLADVVDYLHRLDIEATECFDAERSELSTQSRSDRRNLIMKPASPAADIDIDSSNAVSSSERNT